MTKRCLGCMRLYGSEFSVCPYCGYIEGTKAEEAIHIAPGTLLRDRYIIGKVLGYGGFGVTYIAYDGKLERRVAVKEYLPSEFSTRMPGQSAVTVFSGDKNEQFRQGLEKFIDEAKRLAKFQHEPGIVSIYDSFAENGTAYIIMEYLDGETLADRLKREGTIPEDEAVKMLRPVMESLKAVHKEGILHRDIAPDNVFLTKAGDVKLIDFGASRYATTSHSKSLTVIVKPGFSPEEQYRSRGDQGPWTDVYALAATLYKMITGKTPPDAMERRAKIENERKEILVPPHKLARNISVNREHAILNAMNVQIEDRTANVEAFMEELDADPPVKRRYGKIKKIDFYSWPRWLKIALPSALGVVAALGILLATGVINFPSLFSDKIVIPDGVVVVPGVEGKNIDAAVKELEETGLYPLADGNVMSEYIEAGRIVMQSPVAGSYIEKSGTVRLTVSGGGVVVGPVNGISTVPYVVWDTEEDAVAKLLKAGLAEPEILTASDDNVPAGQVLSQSREAGTKVKEGTKITITVSTGPAAFEMPNVVGTPQDTARKTLADKGLTVTIQYAKDDSVPEGNVISQSVKPGEPVKAGTEITLTVSSGKPTVTVADVVGKTRDSAVSTLEKLGFKVTVLENYDSTVPAGRVISQTPAAGTAQIKGSSVTLYVSRGKQPVRVDFNANGGTVSENNTTVYLTDTYGALPTPKRDYHNFLGWFTSRDGGSRVTASTVVTNPQAHTLYAHWEQKSVSGWVKASEMPSGAQIVEEKWTYNQVTTLKSKNQSEAGYTNTGRTEWGEYGSWSSWSTGGASSSDYRQVETRTVTDREGYNGYVYWTYRTPDGVGWGTKGFSGTSGHGSCTIYDEVVLKDKLTKRYSEWDAWGDYQSPKFSNSNANKWFYDGERRWVDAVTHKEYRYRDRDKLYVHEKLEAKESRTEVYASDSVRDVQKMVRYREK